MINSQPVDIVLKKLNASQMIKSLARAVKRDINEEFTPDDDTLQEIIDLADRLERDNKVRLDGLLLAINNVKVTL